MHERFPYLAGRLLVCVVAVVIPRLAWAADDYSEATDGLPPSLAAAEPWQGFYLGVGAGARWSDATWTTDCLAPAAIPAGCPNDGFFAGTRIGNDNPARFESAKFRLAGYLGFNVQLSHWVVGVEADAGWANAGGTRAGIPGTWSKDLGADLDTATIESEWEGSVRARTGFLMTPRTLIYATGGLALMHQDLGAVCGGLYPVGWCIVPREDSKAALLMGWTLGGGIERMLSPSWILRGEYRYSDYGSRSLTLFEDEPLDSVGVSIEETSSVAYVGLSRRF